MEEQGLSQWAEVGRLGGPSPNHLFWNGLRVMTVRGVVSDGRTSGSLLPTSGVIQAHPDRWTETPPRLSPEGRLASLSPLLRHVPPLTS